MSDDEKTSEEKASAAVETSPEVKDQQEDEWRSKRKSTEKKILILVISIFLVNKLWDRIFPPAKGWGRQLRRAEAPTLVVYVYSDTDPEYINNFKYFVENGIKVRLIQPSVASSAVLHC
jgi:hypothetical protein